MTYWPRTARRSSTNPLFSSVKRLNLLLFSVNITAVGHISIDTVITSEWQLEQIGGPPSFMSAVNDVIGSRVDVITRIGPDFPVAHRELFRERGIDLAPWICESPTTRFILDYTSQPRSLGVGAVCDSIDAADIPESGCVVLSPIVGEIKESLLGSIEPDYLALDPQGLVRKIHGDGSITLEPWKSPHLNRVNLLKTSIREHVFITGEPDPLRSLGKLIENGVDVAVITLGDGGSLVQSEDTRLKVPVSPTDTIDSTGAGDCFLAALSHSLSRGEPLQWFCAWASAVASSVVETRGPIIELSRSAVAERAEKLHEKIQLT
jgi:sugar/nucleoside kinase (ribokinase family)